MNLEQRERLQKRIAQLEGLLAYARAHGETEEAERLMKELMELIEQI